MSYLDSQVSKFSKTLNSASDKIASRRTLANPTVIDISAETYPISNNSQTDLKRKRPEQQNVVYSQPADTGTGRHIMTQVTYAIEYLKTKGSPHSLADLLSYLSLEHREDEYKRTIGTILRSHHKVNYEPKNDGSEDLFSFRPLHNIRAADSLLAHLQSQPTAQGLSVRELRDGWLDAEAAIDELERKGKLLVTRNKKDDHPKMVWPNDPSLSIHIDDEFQIMWEKIKLPEPGAVADQLEKAGLTPTSKSKAPKTKVKQQEQKSKKPRRGGKTTNTHMIGVLRDYSHLKK